MHLLLASNSPRRRELITLIGWPFSAQPADVDESPLAGEAPQDYVLRLAVEKARAAAVAATSDDIIIAADTTVALDGQILGKPADAMQARQMLRQLRGREHQVFTGLAVLQMPDNKLLADYCTTDVPMRAYGDDEIETYIASGDPMDKAGAYAIQHAGFHPVGGLRGCYANVMGLPLCHLVRAFRRLTMQLAADVPAACQQALQYQCPVTQEILSSQG